MLEIYLINQNSMQASTEKTFCDQQVTEGVKEADTLQNETTYFDFDSYSYFLIKIGYL